jgi:hypothetical protein
MDIEYFDVNGLTETKSTKSQRPPVPCATASQTLPNPHQKSKRKILIRYIFLNDQEIE